MHSITTIFKKEIYRVLSDKRLILMIFIVPGLSIFVMYSLIGSLIQTQAVTTITLYETHMPAEIRTHLDALSEDGFDYEPINIDYNTDQTLDETTLRNKVDDGTLDVVLLFEEDFDVKIDNYETMPLPSLTVYYNSSREQSIYSYRLMAQIIQNYHAEKLTDRLEDPAYSTVFTQLPEDLAEERELIAQGISMILPMLIILFLFAGAMSIGPDSIAGEKERHTIATLLITPIKRSHIALGKVTSLALLSLASALSSFLGIVLSLPRLMQSDTNGADMNIYTILDYTIILSILVVTVLLIVGLIAVISAYAKTIKEASMFIMPFYFIAIIIGIITSFGQDPLQMMWVHAIPIYGAVNLLSAVFVFNWSMINFVIVCVTSLIYTSLFIIILGFLFNNEKVMFQK